jgi:hypothetical protein
MLFIMFVGGTFCITAVTASATTFCRFSLMALCSVSKHSFSSLLDIVSDTAGAGAGTGAGAGAGTEALHSFTCLV